MKRQMTTRHFLLSVVVTLAILGTHVWAQPDFHEDFSDGDPADGSPVTWRPIFVWDGEGYTLTDEGLDLAGALLCNPDDTVPSYGDVAITAQIRRHANDSGQQWASGFLFRYNQNWTNGYWMEVRSPNLLLLGYSSGATLAQVVLPFNVDEQDFVIHMEAKGPRIKGWCWATNQAKSTEPQISVVNSNASAGQIALHAWTVGGQTLVRSVTVRSLRTPIVDFNGDGAFNVTDLATFIETWGQDDPTADYWHDGTVDVRDLEIMMDCWGKDVDDPTLAGHWALDETEGDIACDSTGQADAVVAGAAAWQPQAGVLGGALLLDGQNDCVVADPAVNPAEGPFSVLAWVKGGDAGQVIVSQADGQDWLMIDTLAGTLATALSANGRYPTPPLVSDAAITDNDWHRIAVVYDGASRILHVDGAVVAQDVQAAPEACTGTLNIGCGSSSEPGTFFAGLIDDIRIYNRAVKP